MVFFRRAALAMIASFATTAFMAAAAVADDGDRIRAHNG